MTSEQELQHLKDIVNGNVAEFRYYDRQKFVNGVLHLLTCHDHHFAVLVDSMSIRGSQMAMQCLVELEES